MGSEANSPATSPVVPSSPDGVRPARPALQEGGRRADADLSLAGLLDVLDRADVMGPRRPARHRRSVAHRSSRGVALRPVPPLRSPAAAPAAAVPVATAS